MSDYLPLPFDEPAPAAAEARRPLSVSELSQRLKQHVETRFTGLIVEGEISNCKQWSSGHIYFTLKDDYAQIRAVIFRMTARQLKFALEDGMHVVAKGRISLYEVKGEYQLICDSLEPHGLGALQAAFEQLKRRLQSEGLFDQTRKRALPVLPRRIGVVTSLDGAALRDILRVLTRRHPTAQVVIRNARVQGDDAPRDLVRALAAIARVPDVDVVIIGRGGGSVEDLWAFNDESLARAIARCPVPVISAVGHEVDFTIADFVADVRAATPSNAAELVVERADHFCTRIDRAHDRLHRAMRHAAAGWHQRADRLRLRLTHWPVRIAMRDRDREELRLRLQRGILGRAARLHQRLETLRRRLERRDVRQITAEMRTRVVRADARLRALATARQAAAAARAAQLAGRLDALSP
ncbi:MAG TPA: exodeoxyribonuclease VII large subunit, partial [Vicinamibacterales bacterium]|nr:exodeoxyribonuclease VII large subunit [Vicinamibacterales bacterium]